jgi:hypothetical protein
MVQEMHRDEVEIRFVDEMLCNFGLDLHFVFINPISLCSRRNIVPCGVTVLFLLCVQIQELLEVFRDLLCRFTGMESTENILLTTKFLQIILHVLDRALRMVPVTCHKVKIL